MIKKFFKEIVWEYFPVFMALIVIGIMAVLDYRETHVNTETEFNGEIELVTPNPEIWEPS
jgi:hypothetical protein